MNPALNLDPGQNHKGNNHKGAPTVLETSIECEFNFKRPPSSLVSWAAGYPQRLAGCTRYRHEQIFR